MFVGSSGTENSWQGKGLTHKNLLPVGFYCCLTSFSSSLLLSQAAVWGGKGAPAEVYILPRLQANWRRGQDTPMKSSNWKCFFSSSAFFFLIFFFSLNIQHLSVIFLHFSSVIWIQTEPLRDTAWHYLDNCVCSSPNCLFIIPKRQFAQLEILCCLCKKKCISNL